MSKGRIISDGVEFTRVGLPVANASTHSASIADAYNPMAPEERAKRDPFYRYKPRVKLPKGVMAVDVAGVCVGCGIKAASRYTTSGAFCFDCYERRGQ